MKAGSFLFPPYDDSAQWFTLLDYSKKGRITNMKKIEKKVQVEYFKEILSGKKTFELRLNDFEIEEGDVLVLKEWNPEVKNYTGRELERKVGYINRFKINELTRFYTKEEIDEKGIQIISLL